MPHPDPDLRSHISAIGYAAFAARHGIARRTAERIFTGKAKCPPAIRAAALQQPEDRHHG